MKAEAGSGRQSAAAGAAKPPELLIAERTRSPAMKTKTGWDALPGIEKEIDEIRNLWAPSSSPDRGSDPIALGATEPERPAVLDANAQVTAVQ